MKSRKSGGIRHILLVVRWPVGGIRTFLRYVYSRFESDLYSLSIILPQTSELDALRDDLQSKPVNFIVLPESASTQKYVQTIFKVLREKNIDIVHAHGISACVYSFIPSRFMRVPLVFTSHDAAFPKKYFSGIRGGVRKIFLSFVLSKVNMIHSVSYDAQEKLLSAFPLLRNNPERLIVISNGIEVERFLGDGQKDWKQKLCLPADTFIIGFFGRFMAPKGFSYLVDAIGRLVKGKCSPHYIIVLAFGWGGFIREEQEALAQKGLTTYFKFLPFEENIADAIRGVDVVVMPSLWEACPLLPMEALIAGTPIIGTNCIGLREVLRDTPAKVVSAADSGALADAIAGEMKESTRQVVESYRSEAARRYNVGVQVERLKKVYDSL